MKIFAQILFATLAVVVSVLIISVVEAYPTITNYRVTPALGNRSSQYVRVTAVTPTTDGHSSSFQYYFSYAKNFQYRWTTNKVYTTLVPITPGQTSYITIGENELQLNVTVPPPGQGVRGIIVGDLCVISKFAKCEIAHKEDLNVRLHDLLNAAMSNKDMSFMAVAGDVFYDGDGTVTPQFMDVLSPTLKQKFFIATNGNYDIWASGDPKKMAPSDQFGNGFIQTFGQDTMAAKADPNYNPFNFSVNPDAIEPGSKADDYIAAVDNFLSYNQVGNIGFIVFSGAAHHHTMESFFAEACSYFDENKHVVEKIFVLGHWVVDDKGCASNKTTTGNVAQEILNKYSHLGCPHHKVRYFTGHKHCNEKLSDTGFLVGGFGKDDNHCRNFGLPYVDTTGGRLLVAYFPILHNDESMELTKLKDRRRQANENQNSGLTLFSKQDHFRLRHLLKSPGDRYNALISCATLPAGLAGCVVNSSIEVEIWLNESLIK